MASIFERMGMTQEEVNAVPAQKASSSSVLAPGVHDVAIVKAFSRKTESGAEMLEVTYALEDGTTFGISTCTGKKDGTPNKPGIEELVNLCASAGVENPQEVQGIEKFKDAEIQVMGIPALSGKRLKLGIRNEVGEYNGSPTLKNLVSHYMTTAGKNKAGEEILEDASAFIARNPQKVSKAKAPAAASATGSADAAAAAKSGW
jgi:hypothetical protein